MKRRRDGRGAERWSDWWLIGTFTVWTVFAVVDRDWSRAVTPAIFVVGFTIRVLLNRKRRSRAATFVIVATIASVFVVSIIQDAWLMAAVMGIALLGMAGIWGFALRSHKSDRVTDDAS